MLYMEGTMFYKNICDTKPEEFKRLTGVKFDTFTDMIQAIRDAEPLLKIKRGQKRKLCLEDELMMTLRYWREYVTIFSLSKTYGLSECGANKIIHRTERALAGKFKLPGKARILDDDLEFEVFVIDATETPIERPKKGANVTRKTGTAAKRKDIL